MRSTKTQDKRSAVAVTVACGAILLLTASCKQVQDVASATGQTLSNLHPFGSGSSTNVTTPTSIGSAGQIAAAASGNRVNADQIDAAVTAAKTLGLGQAEEEGFGQTLAIKLSQSPGYVADENMTAYVQKVGLAVSSVCGRDDLDFVFGILNDDHVNAISGPRGYVFVTRGLLKQCHDESELAGVLAHEIAHVTQGHGLSAVKQAGLTSAGIKALTASSQMTAMGDLAAKSSDAVIKGVYSQGQEDEADRLAVQYTRAANYDPDGLARLLARVYAGQGSNIFSSHPSTVDRVARIRGTIGTQTGGQTLAERYAANVKF